MKKKRIQLIVLAGVLVVLVALMLIIKKTDAFKEPEEEDTAISLIDAEPGDVKGLSYELDGTNVSLVKSDDTWYVDGVDLAVDQDKANSMVQTVCYLSSDVKIDQADDLSEYGLDEPANTFVLTLSDGSTVSILVGDTEQMSGGTYIKIDGDDSIYVASSYFVSDVAKSLDDIMATGDTEDSDAQSGN